jgi:hypothetical protein
MPKSLREKLEEYKETNRDSVPNITSGNAKFVGTCNFHAGDIDSNGNFTDYKVLVIGGGGIQVRICRSCFRELRSRANLLW